MDPEISGPLEFFPPQSMVEIVNDEENDVVTPVLVLPRIPSRLVSSRPQKASKEDRSTLMHSLVPLSRPYINDEDFVDDTIYVENTVSSATLKGLITRCDSR